MKKNSEKMKKFKKIFDSHAINVYRICLYILRDEEKAEEIAETVFVNFYEHMEEVRPEMVLAHLVVEARNKSHEYKKSMEPRMEE